MDAQRLSLAFRVNHKFHLSFANLLRINNGNYIFHTGLEMRNTCSRCGTTFFGKIHPPPPQKYSNNENRKHKTPTMDACDMIKGSNGETFHFGLYIILLAIVVFCGCREMAIENATQQSSLILEQVSKLISKCISTKYDPMDMLMIVWRMLKWPVTMWPVG